MLGDGIVDLAKEMGLRGATLSMGIEGFGHTGRLYSLHFLSWPTRPQRFVWLSLRMNVQGCPRGDDHHHGKHNHDHHDETHRIDTGHGGVELSVFEQGMLPHLIMPRVKASLRLKRERVAHQWYEPMARLERTCSTTSSGSTIEVRGVELPDRIRPCQPF